MKFGRRFGNYYGHDEAAHVYAAIDPDAPAVRVLSWSAGPSGCVHVVMLDAEARGRGTAAELAGIPPDVRENIEVWECSPQNADESLTLFATSALQHVALGWAEAAGAPARYELYRSLVSGTYADPPIFECPAGQAAYVYRDGPLGDDTYYYRLIGYDAAGNAVTAAEQDVTVNRAPAPPTGVTISHNDGTGLTTVSWTAPADADLDHFAIRYGDPVE
ncbi:MAG TPA: fibronectin type III domain-containing protein, partial [Phycisphaerae bacterium]|nr:fibronectin type III domain-containing protein [Phycisphaerae bacterium]